MKPFEPTLQRKPGERRPCRRDASQRRGAMLVVAAIFLTILLAMAAFAVDVAFIQLTRTELRAATDAAAKAGAGALRLSQDEAAAVAAAINVAADNRVAGKPLVLTADDIELGQSEVQSDGQWQFNPGAQPYRAIRVNVQMGQGLSNGPVGFFFGRTLGENDFAPACTSTASQLEQEVCLVLDRSHSMCFDLSGVSSRYPDPIGSDKELGTKSPPHATGSRWAALSGSVGEFLDVLAQATTPPRLAVITWGSEVTLDSYEGQLTGMSFPTVEVDGPLGTRPDSIRSMLSDRASRPMLGSTNLAAGIDAGTSLLTGPDVRPLAKRVMIVMTDGQWNKGRNPLDAARDAKAAGITIHTITFLTSADAQTMTEIANLAGGKHYLATDAAALAAAFRELAASLPVVLTQ